LSEIDQLTTGQARLTDFLREPVGSEFARQPGREHLG
jgi:hypothetical protein